MEYRKLSKEKQFYWRIREHLPSQNVEKIKTLNFELASLLLSLRSKEKKRIYKINQRKKANIRKKHQKSRMRKVKKIPSVKDNFMTRLFNWFI